MPALLNPPLPAGAHRHLRWHQLYGSAAALALAEATRADRRLYVVIVDAARELERLMAELRFFAAQALPLLRLPDWEVLPYELFSPPPDIISERLKTLFELPQLQRGCLIVSADTLMQRLAPRSYVQGRAFELSKGQALALEPFRQRLTEAGYASVSQVVSPGEFAVRGSLLDVFPMGAAAPLRIDLFDEEIEAIRRFDPETQRSLDALPGVRLLPAREVPLDPQAVKDVRRRFRTRFEGDPTRTGIYRGVSEGLAPAGVEFYQPLFFDSTALLFDYRPADAVIVHDAALPRALVKAWQDIEARYEDRRHDIGRPVLRPAELFLEPAALEAALAGFASITLDAFKAETELHGAPAEVRNFPTTAPRELRVDVRAERPFAPLDAFLSEFEGRVLLAADSAGRREVLLEMLRAQRHEVTIVPGWDAFAAGTARLALTVAPDLEGLTLTAPPIAVIAEAQLFGARARQERRRKRAADPEAILRDLKDLNPGAPVVHEEYGVGRYAGLRPMDIGGQPGEFLVLEYQDGDRIYVPVHALHLVSRYTGAAQAGKQVAVLAPTTLLVQQHLTNFRDRFADWPVRVEALSRFGTSAETQAVLEGLEQGKVDIVIATHRLLHAHARFRDLGLLVIDEEHRFGVRDKQRLQALRANVHVLTLTATPIPRTLNMALGGLRDLSLITTAPAARLAIKTFLIEWHAPTLREAALRELRRGGQVYFVHNEVRTIGKIAAELQSLVPEASLRIGHGQMRERELEQLMVDFYHRRFSVLVCTTIIESGIDVPTANTIMINRA